MSLFAVSGLSRLEVKWAEQLESKLAFGGPRRPSHFELLMVAEGALFLQFGGEKAELRSGDCQLVRPWEQYSGWKRADGNTVFFRVQFSVIPAMLEMEEDNPPGFEARRRIPGAGEEELDPELLFVPRRFRPLRRFEILGQFERLIREMEQPRAYFLYRSTILLMQMLQLLAEDFLCIKRVDGALPGTFVIYRKIVRFLNETYCSDLSREAFESSFDQTREYLCQIFKKYAGIPMLTYVHRLRIQRAKELLQTTGKSVSEIAREVGFQDPYYFSKVFKRLANETPSRYRSPNPKSEIRI